MKLKMIVVDDNKDFTYILCDYLNLVRDLNVTISGIANDGLEAIELITKDEPDILLLDMFMPKLDGIGVLKQIKDMRLRKTPKTIFLSAMGNADTISDALDCGAVYYVEKPFDMKLLISKITQLRDSIILERASASN